jgi:hypothetical protein
VTRLLPALTLLLACCAGLAFALPAHAADVDRLLARAGELQLAQARQWQALLHVNRGGTLRNRGASYVDDTRFFLAADGAQDAQAELDASIRALFDDAQPRGDDTPRCRFVARHRWLAAQLGEPAPDSATHCPAYATWRGEMVADRVTLVFPGSYLNSPSSMFGHTLLRIDPPAVATDTVWLSRAVSFGAQVQPGDNSILYIWKGLGGGYAGGFQVDAYFTRIQQYGRMENRDLWEYPLDLTPDETGLLVDHLWELQGINFDYFFFDENCSYRLLELLEVARPALDLTREPRLSEAPVNTIRALREAGVAQAPALRPSAERALRARLDALSQSEADLAFRLLDDATPLDEPAFLALPRERRQAVLQAAYATVVYRSRKQAGRDARQATHSLALLRAINAQGAPVDAPVAVPAAPESGHDTQRITLGGGALDRGDDAARGEAFLTLGYRPSYHDLLDPLPGYLPGAELEIFDLELRVGEDSGLRLERLDVANVLSLTPHDRFLRSLSWRVRGGLERVPMPDMELHAARQVEGGGGLVFGNAALMLRVFAEARLEQHGSYQDAASIGAGPALGLSGQGERFGWNLAARPLRFADGFARDEVQAGLQWQAARNWGLRAEARWRRGEDGPREAEWFDAQLLLQRHF